MIIKRKGGHNMWLTNEVLRFLLMMKGCYSKYDCGQGGYRY